MKQQFLIASKRLFVVASVALPLVFSPRVDASNSGGLSLLTDGSARASSLAKAYTAGSNDASAMAYNPASLKTLETNHASFLYQEGLIDESYGQIFVGMPRAGKSAIGISAGYYDGGDIQLGFPNGSVRTVNAKRDYVLGLGWARGSGATSFGLSGKFFRSVLAEEYSAQAYALDAGMQTKVGSRVRLGVAALNYGTKIRYGRSGDPLPRVLRAGSALSLATGKMPTTLLLDASYRVNEAILSPAVALESFVGPLAMRAGYRTGGGTNEVTVGAGFAFESFSIDYGFGMADQADGRHTISMAMRYGGAARFDPYVRVPSALPATRPTRTVTAPTKNIPSGSLSINQEKISFPQSRRHVYLVKKGDTLATIAERELGSQDAWKAIYTANRHLMIDANDLQEGMLIIIP